MAITGVLPKQIIAIANQASPVAESFKDVLQKKREMAQVNKLPEISLKHAVSDMIKNHEVATESIKTFMTRTDYSPEKLLKIQYKTGIFFLREQMFCKTAELSANTFKNFTQMQI
jgi:hypothetical protein